MTGNLRGNWDAERLQQLISNLVVNGLKYGAPRSKVRVNAIGRDDDVVLAFENHGKPIAPSELASCSTRFDEVPSTRPKRAA